MRAMSPSRFAGWLVLGSLVACNKPPEPTPKAEPKQSEPAPKASPKVVPVSNASVTPQPVASAEPPAVKVTDVRGLKDAMFSPWTLPDLTKLGVPSGLPFPSAIPVVIPSAIPWPFPSAPPTGNPAPKTTTTAPPIPMPTATAAKKAPYVFLYGADWCGACKSAKAHIESRKIVYTYRNVDDDAANKEMAIKLKASGKSGGSIPVIDLEGELQIGWSPSAFDQAYDAKCK